MLEKARTVLKTVFGYSDFRGQQAQIIENTLAQKSALVLMPTGAGKSICYQLPALLMQGTAVVISPLIALMQNQVTALLQLNVQAAYLNSSQDAQTQAAIEQQLRQGALKILYLSPERLMSQHTQNLLAQIQISLFAIDEAHCVSQWGHDFRPEYQQLSFLAQQFASVPRMALTATADQPTRADIIRNLSLDNAPQFISSFDRPNIHYRIVAKNQSNQQLVDFIDQHRQESGIVYCLARSKVERVGAFLRERGIDALCYHAGMSQSERSANQQAFILGEAVVMVATIAFGMGIDKPNVRFVVHMDLPKSIEAYYQETGRAGRDGLPAYTLLLYGMADVIRLRQMREQSNLNATQQRVEQQKLNAMLALCELCTCRRAALLHYFGEQGAASCPNCDNCQQPPATLDATVAAQQALSAVYRTGQSYGVAYVINVLMGKDDPLIAKRGHQNLAIYGIGSDFGIANWRNLFRQLLAFGYIQANVNRGGAVELTASARPILKGEQKMAIRKITPSRKNKTRSSASLSIPAHQQGLFDQLRALRMELAQRENIAPYMVFSDASLLEMVEKRPTSIADFANISGVGSHKLKKYAVAFVSAIGADVPIGSG